MSPLVTVLPRRCLVRHSIAYRAYLSCPFSTSGDDDKTRRIGPELPSHDEIVQPISVRPGASSISYGRRQWLSSDVAHRIASKQQKILELSPIMEPPLVSDVLEKPCTVILMEDRWIHGTDENGNYVTTASWMEPLQSSIATECGMSFATICFQSTSDNGTIPRVQDCLNVLKASPLSRIHDAVLIARGPFSSICAQYYLESLPLQGLIMVDPILLWNDDTNEHLKSILANSNIDKSDWDRFHSNKLRLEPNAVPMMVVLSTRDVACNAASRNVAERHSAENGPYGIVPVVDILMEWKVEERAKAERMVDLVNDWIDDNVL